MSDITDLISLLSSKTAEGKLRWELDGDSRIISHQGESVIEVDLFDWPDGNHIAVRNRDGIAIVQQSFPDGTPENDILWELFERAKRDALGVDKTLDDLKSRLLSL